MTQLQGSHILKINVKCCFLMLPLCELLKYSPFPQIGLLTYNHLTCLEKKRGEKKQTVTYATFTLASACVRSSDHLPMGFHV